MRTVAFVCLVVMGFSVARGQESVVPHVALAPTPRPATSHAVPGPACPAPAATASCGATARLEHLVEAAVHLEAAGETVQAQQVRQLVARERQILASRLGKQMPTEDVRQVLVQLRVVEVSQSKLKKLGFEWEYLTSDGAKKTNQVNAFTLNVLDGKKGLLPMLEALRKDGLGRVLAEPTLVGVSGRPMSFHSGGLISQTSGGGLGQPGRHEDLVEIGTRVDLVPLVLTPDQIRLDMKVTVAEPVETQATSGTEQQFSEAKVLSVDTAIEMKSGQTCVVSGLSQSAGNQDEETRETLVLITSEIIDHPFTAQTVEPAAATN